MICAPVTPILICTPRRPATADLKSGRARIIVTLCY
jgi:hypothetical protein